MLRMTMSRMLLMVQTAALIVRHGSFRKFPSTPHSAHTQPLSVHHNACDLTRERAVLTDRQGAPHHRSHQLARFSVHILTTQASHCKRTGTNPRTQGVAVPGHLARDDPTRQAHPSFPGRNDEAARRTDQNSVESILERHDLCKFQCNSCSCWISPLHLTRPRRILTFRSETPKT